MPEENVTPAHSAGRPTPKRRTAKRQSPKPISREIESSLTAIYQDEQGKIPTLTAIKKPERKGGLFSCFLFVGAVAALLVYAFIFHNGKAPSDQDVTIAIEGPTDVAIDATTTYTVRISNNSNAKLQKTTLNLTPPEGFLFITSTPAASNAGHTEWKLDSFLPNKEVVVTVVGKPYGSLDDKKTWRAFFTYEPSNFTSELQASAALPVNISTSPVSIAISGPDKVTVGSDAKYSFSVTNLGSTLNTVQLAPIVPTNFQITSSSPALVKNRWNVALSATPTPYTITGKFTGADTSTIRAAALLPGATNNSYTIASASLNPEISNANTSLRLAINGATSDISAGPGSTLQLTLEFKNTSADTLKNGVLHLGFDAPSQKKQSLLAWSSIKDTYDGDIQGVQLSNVRRSGEITWNSKKISALTTIKGGQSVVVDLALPLKSAKDFDYSSIIDPTILVTASIDYTDSKGVAKSMDITPLTISLESGIVFSVDHETAGNDHHVTWSLTNNFHALKNVKISADVFGSIAVTPGSGPGQMIFDQATKKITWSFASLPTSSSDSVRSFTINIANPNPTQSLLVSKVTIEADDTVTGEHIQKTGNEVKLIP